MKLVIGFLVLQTLKACSPFSARLRGAWLHIPNRKVGPGREGQVMPSQIKLAVEGQPLEVIRQKPVGHWKEKKVPCCPKQLLGGATFICEVKERGVLPTT